VRVRVCVRICVQRLTLEARQQDIRDKQLVVQQSGEYVEKLKVRLWACLSWEGRIKHVQCGCKDAVDAQTSHRAARLAPNWKRRS
jgi:hypothetical protein